MQPRSKRSTVVVERGLCVTSGAIDLTFVSLCAGEMWIVDILHAESDANCDTNSTDLECLKCSLKFILL